MNCSEVQNQLSAYFDGELPIEVEAMITSHLEDCTACAENLAGFEQLSRLTAALPDPAVPEKRWDQFESARDRQPEVPSRPITASVWKPQFSRRLFAIAATVFIAGGLSFFAYREWHVSEEQEHEHLAINFEHYLEDFDENPHAAQQILMAEYNGQLTTIKQAAQVLKYDPVITKGLPSGCSVENVYLLDMPCCRCAQAVCKCHGSHHVAVFEHDIDQPVWFGDRPKLDCLCHEKKTSIVQVEDRLAATWTEGNRFITIIGARDLAEVTRFVAHFSGTKSNG